MNDPILANDLIRYAGYQNRVRLFVKGGLHYMKGNAKPYFSLTAEIKASGHYVAGGCQHDVILKRFPKFKDMAALHLSDIDGVPSHAEANGWYNYAGAFGGLDERYHRGNSKCQMWKENGEFDGYREPTPDECLKFFADHVRITIEEAQKVKETIGTSREAFKAWIEAQKPRWKAEAEACIAKHGLVVYGDKWEG